MMVPMIEITAREISRNIVNFREQKKSHNCWIKLRCFVVTIVRSFMKMATGIAERRNHSGRPFVRCAGRDNSR